MYFCVSYSFQSVIYHHAARPRHARLCCWHQASISMEVCGWMAPGKRVPWPDAFPILGDSEGSLCKCVGILAPKWLLWGWDNASEIEGLFQRPERSIPQRKVLWEGLMWLFLFRSPVYFHTGSPSNQINVWGNLQNNVSGMVSLLWHPTTVYFFLGKSPNCWSMLMTSSQDHSYVQDLHTGEHGAGQAKPIPRNWLCIQGSIYERSYVVLHQSCHRVGRSTPRWYSLKFRYTMLGSGCTVKASWSLKPRNYIVK